MADAPHFEGASTHSLDDKSRLNVPKRFRDALQAAADGEVSKQFVLTASPDGCLLILSRGQLESWADELGDGSPADDPGRRDQRRALLGHAESAKPDNAGRLLLPEMMRAWLELDSNQKEVVLVGTGSAIEIWSSKEWARRRERILGGSFQQSSEVESKAG